MNRLDLITPENFDNSFNIVDVLKESVFYPASGMDAFDIEVLFTKSNSFIHVDYSCSGDTVKAAMRSDFESLGYQLVGLKEVDKEELTPNGFRFEDFTLNEHEQNRLEEDDVKNKFEGSYIKPFAVWAVYELNSAKTGKTEGKVPRFSLLHVGGEACAALEALYVNNGVNPLAVTILAPGEGYGDNWTLFTNESYRLYQSLVRNSEENSAEMPKYLLTNKKGDGQSCCWSEYEQVGEFYRPKSAEYVQLYSL